MAVKIRAALPSECADARLDPRLQPDVRLPNGVTAIDHKHATSHKR